MQIWSSKFTTYLHLSQTLVNPFFRPVYVVQLSKGLHPVPGNVYFTQYHSFFLGIEKNEIEIQEHVCKLIVLYFPVPLVQKLIKGTRFVFLLFKRIFLKKISVFFLEQPIFNL